jgi:hypothetical protein
MTPPLRLFAAAAVALLVIAIVGGCAWVNYVALTEAFGSGPPYYGQTTNMDKWSNPLPMLVAIDAAVLLVTVALVSLGVWLVSGSDRSPTTW